MGKLIGPIMLVVGILGAASMAILAGVVPSLNDDHSFTAWVFVASMLLLTAGFAVSMEAKRASPSALDGIAAEGTIVSIEATGTEVNGDRQYMITARFTTGDGQQITAQDYRVLPVSEAVKLEPGTPVVLRYNPARPSEMRIRLSSDVVRTGLPGVEYSADAATAVSSDAPVLDAALADRGESVALPWSSADEPSRPLFGPLTRDDEDRIDTGVHAQGVVMEASPTGNIVSGLGELKLRIFVTRPDDTHFEVTTIRPVSPAALPICVPGHVIGVYYHPDNEQQLTLAG